MHYFLHLNLIFTTNRRFVKRRLLKECKILNLITVLTSTTNKFMRKQVKNGLLFQVHKRRRLKKWRASPQYKMKQLCKNRIKKPFKTVVPNSFSDNKKLSPSQNRLYSVVLKILQKRVKHNKDRNLLLEKKRLLRSKNLVGFKFFSKIVSKLTKDGKKKKAFRTVLKTFLGLNLLWKKKTPPINFVAFSLLHKLNPRFQFRKKNFGRRSVIVPQLILPTKKIPTAAKWLKQTLRSQRGKGIRATQKLIREIRAAFLNKGELIKIRNSQTKLAVENKINAKPKYKKPLFKKRRPNVINKPKTR